MPRKRVIVYDKVLQQDMYYKGVVILSYTVRYPYFALDKYQITLDKLNHYYKTEAYMYVKTNIAKLYQAAMVEYEYAVANNFPVRPFDVVSVYEITYNSDCVLSLYFDRYEYTGGAHGITIRTSDSWNIACNRNSRTFVALWNRRCSPPKILLDLKGCLKSLCYLKYLQAVL